MLALIAKWEERPLLSAGTTLGRADLDTLSGDVVFGSADAIWQYEHHWGLWRLACRFEHGTLSAALPPHLVRL